MIPHTAIVSCSFLSTFLVSSSSVMAFFFPTVIRRHWKQRQQTLFTSSLVLPSFNRRNNDYDDSWFPDNDYNDDSWLPPDANFMDRSYVDQLFDQAAQAYQQKQQQQQPPPPQSARQPPSSDDNDIYVDVNYEKKAPQQVPPPPPQDNINAASPFQVPFSMTGTAKPVNRQLQEEQAYMESLNNNDNNNNVWSQNTPYTNNEYGVRNGYTEPLDFVQNEEWRRQQKQSSRSVSSWTNPFLQRDKQRESRWPSRQPIREDEYPQYNSLKEEKVQQQRYPIRNGGISEQVKADAIRRVQQQQQRRKRQQLQSTRMASENNGESKYTVRQKVASFQSFMVGAIVGMVAFAPFSALNHFVLFPSYEGAAQWEWNTGTSLLQGGLFAVVYRYSLRQDMEQRDLQTVLYITFVLIRSLVGVRVPMHCTSLPLQCGEPLEIMDWTMIGELSINFVESVYLFGTVSLAMDFLLKQNWICRFPS